MDALFDMIRQQDSNRAMAELAEGAIFKVLFLQRDPLIVNGIFPALAKKMTSKQFQDCFMREHLRVLSAKHHAILSDIQKCELAGQDSRFYKFQLPALEHEMGLPSFDAYLEFLSNPAEGRSAVIEILINEYEYLNDGADSGADYVSEHYEIYRIGSFLYEQSLKKVGLFDRFEQREKSRLEAIYREQGVELSTTDAQFSKYGLLSFRDGFRIDNDKDSQVIIDEHLGRHYGIEVPRNVLAAIEYAMAKGWVKDIAFNICSIGDGSRLSMEDLEYGSLFSFDALHLPEFSKLYEAECYENSLWIKVDKSKSSMTFEELCADFPELDGNVITQLVHLEVSMVAGQPVISHIDHEFILYDLESYADRLDKPKIKGKRKVKTFKIDNAEIPFDFIFRDRLFLYQVLDSYFSHKSLIREYFVSVGSQ
ncbi:hypothetical protein QCD61_03685 [Pseudomonas viciae]|uniref:Uncharacterized protein n=1 Tax=Pseudomonas viciae TaxID=2505979 RepID=A0ABY8PG46_9PSED|nr:hypothetical protein [Pseudomonas viciae]WGO94194.1 hypothetical protein QCD61_03685 [Pseudomonas viciae]